MVRPTRYLPDESLVETTTRTLQGRFFLRPCPEVKSIMIGVTARAMERFGMKVTFMTALSNHAHYLLRPEDQRQLSRFMQYVNSNIARKVSRLFGWKEKFWGRRYRAIVVADCEETQVARLRYLLEHGVKENLVASPLDWPGATSVHAYVDGTFEMSGHWVDHTAVWKESKLWHRRVSPSGKTKSEKVLKRQLEKEFTSRHKLKLTPLPKWDDLSLEEVSAKVRWMVEDIEFKAAARHKANGTRPLGVEAILSQRREDAPRRVKRAYAPPVHAKNPEDREEFLAAYRKFLFRYRRASYWLRKGVKDAVFPKGCFPPGLPFVEHDPELRPG